MDKLYDVLKNRSLTIDEIQNILSGYSNYEIARLIIENPRIKQNNDFLNDDKIRYTAG